MIVASMSVAFAAATGSITVKGNDTVSVTSKTFKAYKILDAVFSADGKNVSYSVPASMKNFYDGYFKGESATATAAATAAGKTFDQYIADEIAKLTKAADLQAFVKAALVAAKASVTPVESTSAKMEGLVSGYYIVEDQATQAPISSLMLDTVNNANVDIVVKANVPTPDKEMYEGTGTAKANNVTVGDKVNYVITQNVPNYTGYDYFYFIINDTLSSGLTFNNDIKVTVGGTEITASADNGYYLYTGNDADGKTFKISFKDISKFDIDADIVVTYSATLNSDAVVGEDPNTNDVYIEYSNNPEKSEQKDKEGQPGIPASQQDHPTGEGPHDFNDTYTTQIDLHKVDATTNEKTALPGVQFTLTGTSKVTVITTEEYFEEDSVAGTHYLLKTGAYTTTAPTTTSSMTEAAAGATSGYVEETSAYTGKDAITVGGKVYRPYKASDAGKKVYILTLANDNDYVSTVVKYSMKTATTQAKIDRPVKMVGTTDASGNITFKDLGAGTYTLSETKVPDGYNAIPDQTFTISCSVPADADVKAGTEKATWTKDSTLTEDGDGTFSITLENKKGVELPSTGGMGTTILYVGGSILVLAAAILLITKRRMGSED